jgi:hypothetical protein
LAVTVYHTIYDHRFEVSLSEHTVNICGSAHPTYKALTTFETNGSASGCGKIKNPGLDLT